MPRFFFDTHDGGHSICDDEGIELASSDAAGRQALASLPDIARDVLPGDGDRHDITVDVRDETGRLMFTATLSLVARWID